MEKDIRCLEIKNNPRNVIPEYFEKGLLNKQSLWKCGKNALVYKVTNAKIRETLNRQEISVDNYIITAEEAFLLGKAGLITWARCLRGIILYSFGIRYTQKEILETKIEEIDDKDILEERFRKKLAQFDKEHIWMFDAGLVGRRSFSGNPKYLFIYINKYRPDICAYWICEKDSNSVVNDIRKIGYDAFSLGTDIADYAISKTGVVVSELLRESYLGGLENTKYVNLWHGIGFKHIERGITQDISDLRLGIAKKYITNNTYLQNNQLVVVTSPIYEEEFKKDLGVRDDQLIRTGYLRCLYQKGYERIQTYEHDIKKIKNLQENTRLAVYIPTYRASRGNAFSSGMCDLELLHKICKENNILFIFKVHPQIEKELGFLNAWEKYENYPYFLFWDNKNDFYEIMDKIDLVVYDYSSMFSDFLCAGVKNYIRYIYDEEEYMKDGFTQGKKAYYDRTCGKVCHNFNELLDAIANYEENHNSEEVEQTYKKLWVYTGDDDFEKTIDTVFSYFPAKIEYPTLYSFDVFDTLISRKGLHPYSIFYAVKEKMKLDAGFPSDLVERYPIIRHSAEMNVREYYKKTTQIRNSEKIEIQMYEIFDRISSFYNLSEEQKKQLMNWEIEEEIDSVVPLYAQINQVKKHLNNGNKVVLISDMYLPKSIIKRMVMKAEPILGELPLFVSSEYGVQKTTKLLYFEVYRSFSPYYQFGRWIHCGDNILADKISARSLGINTVTIDKVEFNHVENTLISSLKNYNAYLMSAMCARLREKYKFHYKKAEFVINTVGMILIPYVDWVIRDALKKGFEELVFVARDGYLLKIIADSLIQTNNWKIKTKYLYASRRTWRIQSYFDKIDDIFWLDQGGNFNDIYSKEEMLKALYLDEEKFKELLPHIDLDSINWTENQPGRKLASIIKKSEKYEKYLLELAAIKRSVSCAYLKQELSIDKKFACVEYWGRGYNQECMERLWNYVTGKKENSYFYYARTILPTEGRCVRYNMTSMDGNVAWMEAIFANMPYSSIEDYKDVDGKIIPVLNYTDTYDPSLLSAEEEILPIMAKQYAKLKFSDTQNWNKNLYDFTHEYINNNRTRVEISESIGSLKYSMSMHGNVREYARKYQMSDLNDFLNKVPRGKNTHSIQMSYSRSNDEVKVRYNKIYQIEDGDDPAKGVLLSREEVTINDNYRVKYNTNLKRSELAAQIYEAECKVCEVQNKVSILSMGNNLDSDILGIINAKFKELDMINIEYLSCDRKQDFDEELVRNIASAKFIIVVDNVVQLLNIKFRKETICFYLLDRGFRLYNFGKTENLKLKWQYRYNSLMHRRNGSIYESTSLESKELCGYDVDLNNVDKLYGACITDVLNDKSYKQDSYEKIWDLVPESRGKKIIFYMPLPRIRRQSRTQLELLDLEELSNLLGKNFFIFVDLRSNRTLAKKGKNVIDIDGFSKNITEENISLRRVLSVADIIIGDYRDTFFESALLDRPVYSTAIDLHEVQSNSSNMIYNLAAFYPFPIIRNAKELADQILEGKYNFDEVVKFRNKYLVGCDGRCVDRIVEYIKNMFSIED